MYTGRAVVRALYGVGDRRVRVRAEEEASGWEPVAHG